ncbi:MAG: radical SAM protein [Candidatus Micrarchaeota archaeon]
MGKNALLIHVPCGSTTEKESTTYKKLKEEFLEAYFLYRLQTVYRNLAPESLKNAENTHLLNFALLSFAPILKNEGINVTYLAGSEKKIRQELSSFPEKPFFVAFSSPHASSLPITEKLATTAKKRWPDVLTIVGGQYINLVNSMKNIDLIVHGDGFIPLFAVAKGWKPSSSVITNISVPESLSSEFKKRYEEFLYPDVSFVPPTPMPIGRIYFQRGCLYGSHKTSCKACLVTSGKNLKTANDPERILKALEEMKERFGTNYFFIADDDFLANPNAARELLLKISSWRSKPSNSSITFSFQCRVSSFLEFIEKFRDATRLFKDAGIVEVQFGVESFHQRLVDEFWGGKFKVDELPKALENAKNAGLYTLCNVQFGLPGETEEEMQRTKTKIRSFMKKGLTDFVDPYFLTEFSKGGYRTEYEFSEYPSMWSDKANKESIKTCRDETMKEMTKIFLRRLKKGKELEGKKIFVPTKALT